MFPLFLLCFGFPFSDGVVIRGIGSTGMVNLLNMYFYSYNQIRPDVTFEWISGTTPTNSTAQVVNSNKTNHYDFASTDFYYPSELDYAKKPTMQSIPLVTWIPALQYFLVGVPKLVLAREALAQIYMGNLTNWNDTRIRETNPGVNLPNLPIKVYYRNVTSLTNQFFTSGLAAFSEEWRSLYGINSTFPSYLTTLPNFLPVTSDLKAGGAIVNNMGSIGYLSFAETIRDAQLTYAHFINQRNETVGINSASIGAAMSTAQFNSRLNANYSVDSPAPGAYPFGTYTYLLLDTDFPDCQHSREVLKFIKWFLTAEGPRARGLAFGYAPLHPSVVKIVLEDIGEWTCNDDSILKYNDVDYIPRQGVTFIIFFVVALLIFLFGLFLSAIHVRHFSQTHINLFYSIIFVLGAALTLFAPLFWFFTPSQQYVCNSRLWTTALGFTILLGTMFSRTSQLRDIYMGQKKKFETLKHSTSRNSIVKLTVTLTILLTFQLIILTAWQASDPLISKFKITNELRFEGHWGCYSKQVHWIIIEIVFFLTLILFGVYVIYQTWSFQKKVVVIETRWVLLALYNIVLTICAITPLMSMVELTDAMLSLLAIIAIDLSGGGIVAAVLLPRVLEKMEWSTHSKSGGGHNKGETVVSTSPKNADGSKAGGGRKTTHLKEKSEFSRTPEMELAARLEDPQPLRKKDGHSVISTIDESSPKHGAAESADEVMELCSLRRDRDHSTIAEEPSLSLNPPSPHNNSLPSPHLPGDLTWNNNPIRNHTSSTDTEARGFLLPSDLDASTASSGGQQD